MDDDLKGLIIITITLTIAGICIVFALHALFMTDSC